MGSFRSCITSTVVVNGYHRALQDGFLNHVGCEWVPSAGERSQRGVIIAALMAGAGEDVWKSFLGGDVPPSREEQLKEARTTISMLQEESQAKGQQLELMSAMLKAAEEELALRFNQLELVNAMLKATDASASSWLPSPSYVMDRSWAILLIPSISIANFPSATNSASAELSANASGVLLQPLMR